MNRDEIILALRARGWEDFYSPNNWLNRSLGHTDYSGRPMCQAYVEEFYPSLTGVDKLNKVLELEYLVNKGKKLYLVGNSFKIKEDLKSRFNAKWDAKERKWFVSDELILDHNFHTFVYDANLSFKWSA